MAPTRAGPGLFKIIFKYNILHLCSEYPWCDVDSSEALVSVALVCFSFQREVHVLTRGVLLVD